jgi:hypothetical protein
MLEILEHLLGRSDCAASSGNQEITRPAVIADVKTLMALFAFMYDSIVEQLCTTIKL